MRIRNNINNIDEKLLADIFPNANVISKPSIVKFSDPLDDFVCADITDWYGITTLQIVRLVDVNKTSHWPGEFGFSGDEDSCVSPCYWIFNNWKPVCDNCQFI